MTTLTNIIYNKKVAHDLEDLKSIIVEVNTRSIEFEEAEATADIQHTILMNHHATVKNQQKSGLKRKNH